MLRAGIEECGGGGLGVWGVYIPWVAALLMLFFFVLCTAWPFLAFHILHNNIYPFPIHTPAMK